MDRLDRFVRAYQDVDPLKIGELWAIAVTLRITLVENLRRLIEIVITRLDDAERADAIAKRVLAFPDNSEASFNPDTVMPDSAISATMIARLEQRLRNQNVPGNTLLQRLETELQRQGTNGETLIQEEYQRQAADDISVRNVINAMRLVSAMDWSDFVENVSLVDRELREDPGFGAMDFPSRDRYRRAVEELARRSPLDEIAVATAAVHAAKAATGQTARESDPGYYLIGDGKFGFGKKIGYQPSYSQRLWLGAAATGLTGYLIFIALVTGIFAAGALVVAVYAGVSQTFLAIFALLALLPASDLATAIVNRTIANRWGPKILPALALKEGVPDSLRTLLVVPVLLAREDAIAKQIAQLEVHYLSNADARLRFALLSDWMDSPTESAPSDDSLLNSALAGIRELNEHYAKGGPPLFALLHRKRQWNPAQGVWMGVGAQTRQTP